MNKKRKKEIVDRFRNLKNSSNDSIETARWLYRSGGITQIEYDWLLEHLLDIEDEIENKEAKEQVKEEPSTSDKIKETLSAMIDLLLYKNKKYGDSALKPNNIFYKGSSTNSILIRLDDKIGRIKNNTGIASNDVCDIIGYCTLLLISIGINKQDIEKLKDDEKYTFDSLTKNNIFYKGDILNLILIYLDLLISKIRNSEEVAYADICDVIGYCTLLLTRMGVTIKDIQKLKD